MDYENKQEIPFGAFDSELMRQEISIPDGFEAVIEGNKIILKKIESEDERIRKKLITFFQRFPYTNLYDEGLNAKDVLAWLEKQGEQEQLYIRFGEIPTDEKSKIFQGEIEVGTENGVSVYPALKTSEGDIVLGLSLPITKTTLYTQQHLIEYDDKPFYLVSVDYEGKYTDGHPLSNNDSIIEKIDTYRVKEKKQGEHKLAWSEEDKKLTDVNHEYFSELLENNNSKDINDYAYQVAYCMSHDWANETPTWDDVQKACKLGAEWNEKHMKGE